MNDKRLCKELIDFVGPTLVSLASGANKRRCAELWLTGVITDMEDSERQRLELALECLQNIERLEGSGMAHAWFIGSNTGDDSISPVEALREDRLDEVRISMTRFTNTECMGG